MRLGHALLATLLVSWGSLNGCSDDPAATAPDSGAAAGESGGPASASGNGGDGAGPSSSDGGTASEGGTTGAGGVPGAAGSAAPGGSNGLGEGGTSAEAGSAALGGEAGMPNAGPPDLITTSGGPWPDSQSAQCSNASQLISCPQLADAFFGQDGTYRINVPSYTSTVTTVTDKVTGLMWEKEPTTNETSQADAAGYCESLAVAGHTDWRLPTRLEYVTVLDLGRQSGYALPGVFSITSTGPHWTASTSGATEDGFFSVHDSDGTWTIAIASTTSRVRCVRGTPLTGTLQVDTDTTTDSMTNLEWQTSALDDSGVTWQQALSYCEALEHASKSDWRLPNIKELASIVDEAALVAPAVDPVSFGTSSAEAYWSSTPALSFGSERFALLLNTSLGYSPSLKVTELAAARCVRTAD